MKITDEDIEEYLRLTKEEGAGEISRSKASAEIRMLVNTVVACKAQKGYRGSLQLLYLTYAIPLKVNTANLIKWNLIEITERKRMFQTRS